MRCFREKFSQSLCSLSASPNNNWRRGCLLTWTMKVAFTDSRTNEVLWSNDALTFRGEYELTTRGNTEIQGAAFVDQERSSVDRIASDVARTVVTSILEAF